MINVQMSQRELAHTAGKVAEVNKKFTRPDGTLKTELGKNSFLKLLVTELRHQDPTNPMQDKEFIAQMAQFSSLEEMTSLNKNMRELNKSARAGEAYSLLGKRVDAQDPKSGKPVTGIVSSIYYNNDDIRLRVNDRELSLSDVHAVHAVEQKAAAIPKLDKAIEPKPILKK